MLSAYTMTHPESSRPQPAKVRPSKTLVSTVWLIPLAAAIIGAWLLIDHIRTRGPEIRLFMDNADGIEVNNTSIRVLNVEVGRVSGIALNPERNGVVITAKLNRDSMALMKKDTQFWVVKPRIDQNGVTGLGTLLSGSYIAFTPGNSTEDAREFKVQDLPPISAIGQSGTRLSLKGKNSKMLGTGSPVMFENHIVGTVETARFNAASRETEYSIFIYSPNESLLNSDSRFWIDSGVNVRLDGGGLSVSAAPLSALLSGALAFSTPEYGNAQAVSNGQEFTVYNNRAEIENQPDERTLYYTAFFNSSVRGLDIGAPVEYKGVRVGTVAEVPFYQNGDQTRLFANGHVPVRIRIDPDRIERGGEKQSKQYWQDAFQAALSRGLTANLSSNNLILGSKMIELSDTASDMPAYKPHNEYGGHTVIATRGGGLDELQAQLAKLLEKFNALPLDKTVGELNGSLKELRKTLAGVNKLVANRQTQAIPAELNQTLQSLRQTLAGVSPESPVYQDVQATLQSIDRTLKDARPLLNTLNEKPNALIFNRSVQDPTPKGSRP